MQGAQVQSLVGELRYPTRHTTCHMSHEFGSFTQEINIYSHFAQSHFSSAHLHSENSGIRYKKKADLFFHSTCLLKSLFLVLIIFSRKKQPKKLRKKWTSSWCQALLLLTFDHHVPGLSSSLFGRVGWSTGPRLRRVWGGEFMGHGCPMPHLELSLGTGRRVQETSLKHRQGLQS